MATGPAVTAGQRSLGGFWRLRELVVRDDFGSHMLIVAEECEFVYRMIGEIFGARSDVRF